MLPGNVVASFIFAGQSHSAHLDYSLTGAARVHGDQEFIILFLDGYGLHVALYRPGHIFNQKTYIFFSGGLKTSLASTPWRTFLPFLPRDTPMIIDVGQ